MPADFVLQNGSNTFVIMSAGSLDLVGDRMRAGAACAVWTDTRPARSPCTHRVGRVDDQVQQHLLQLHVSPSMVGSAGSSVVTTATRCVSKSDRMSSIVSRTS